MWLVHIDTWNYADPQKIIALIPEDIRPYVVMNIALSISHDSESRFQVAEYGYETAKSWLRACAENRMWAMVQPSSGGYSQFSDFDLSVYEEFFRDYPNCIGFNYCEQFWGFDDADPLSAAWTDRVNHWADLLELSHQYGGYLVISWCGNQWNPAINPIGMLKRNPAFAAACQHYTENYILCEKYTQQSYQSDMESLCLGAYLSGYSGNYGIRYDDTGWTDAAGNHANFTMATYGAPMLEHAMLTGQTVVDGPELIWTQCFHEISAGATSNGYTMRRWETFPQFDNVSVDLFRKILDGTVRIPSRQEVIDRTKLVIVNDVSSGTDDEKYSSPETMFEGLYRMDGDGNYEFNKTFFKKTGRYPTVPTVYRLHDALAQSFQVQVNRSGYPSRWPAIASKVTEFDSLFPSEYTGGLYAGRHENRWVTYNPYKSNLTASASIPFKYNTCDRMELAYSRYTSGVIKEYSNSVSFYLCNYQNEIDTGLKTDTIKIYGSTAEPTWSYADRGSHQGSIVTQEWLGGVFTLTVQHNGSLDITVDCEGTATNRLTAYTPASVTTPDQPLVYAGPRQYEGECFDYKSIAGIVKNGYYGSIRNYTGQGYLQFGTSSSAAVRDMVNVPKAGAYRLETRYAVTGGDINTIDLYVNGAKVGDPVFTQTASLNDWAINDHYITLNAGENTIEFKATGAGASSIYFDNIVVVPREYGDGLVIEENTPGFAGVDGVIGTNNAGYNGDGYADTYDSADVGMDWALDFDSSAVKSFTYRYASTSDRAADLLVNGTNVATNIQFPSTGSLTNWDYVTVYAGVDAGISGVRLQSISDSGLPNVDSLEVTGATTWAPGSLPYVPLGLTGTPVSTSQIDLSWLMAPGADSYNVERASMSGGPYTAIASNVVATSYSDTGLSELTTYYYVLSAVNTNGGSADSAEVGATTLTTYPPAAPSGLVAVAVSFDQADLSWTAPLGADSYLVKRSIYSGGPYTTVAISVTGTTHRDTGLFADTTYYYIVSAVNVNGEGADSAEANMTTPDTALLQPIDDTYVRDGGSAELNFGTADILGVKYDTNNAGFTRNTFLKFDVSSLAHAQSVTLKWTPYQVDGPVTLDYELVTDDSWTETGMTWNNQPAGSGNVVASASGYAVGVQKAINVTDAVTNEAAGDGVLSLKVSNPTTSWMFLGFNSKEAAGSHPVLECTLSPVYTLPATPADLVATGVNSNQIDLSWTASSGASSYNVHRALVSGGPYTLIATGVSGPTCSDSGLSEGTPYHYVVSAINGAGESADSIEASVIPHDNTYGEGSIHGESGGIVSMEAEHGIIGSRWMTGANAGASGDVYIEIDPAHENLGTPESGPESVVEYDFHISTGGNYRFWFRMYSSGANDDSFYWRIDGGSWNTENNRSGIGSWFSTDNVQVNSLNPGNHVLEISYRENGTRLDKFVIQLDGLTVPSGNGPQEAILPRIPTGLSAIAVSASRIDLSWPASAGAAGYNVKRSTSSGEPYESVVSNLVALTYSDVSGLSAGTRYYYVISAVNIGGESGNSDETNAVPSAMIVPGEYVIAGYSVAGGTNLSLTISNSVLGHDYTVWATDNLTEPDWQPAGVTQAGTGSDLDFNVPVDGRASRFFNLDVRRQ